MTILEKIEQALEVASRVSDIVILEVRLDKSSMEKFEDEMAAMMGIKFDARKEIRLHGIPVRMVETTREMSLIITTQEIYEGIK